MALALKLGLKTLALQSVTTPAWISALRTPQGDLPTLALDFQHGRYWLIDTLVSIGDVCTQDATNWGPFSPSDITPGVGYVGSGAGPVLTSEAFAAVGREFTGLMVGDMTSGASGDYFDVDLVEFPGYDTEWWSTLKAAVPSEMKAYNDINPTQNVINALPTANLGQTKIAWNFAATRLAGSVDGSTVGTATVAATVTPLATNIAIGCSGKALQLVAFYSLQPEGDLPSIGPVPFG